MFAVVSGAKFARIVMLHFTRQQQLVLCVALFLLLIGWAVKAWRLSQRPAPPLSEVSQ